MHELQRANEALSQQMRTNAAVIQRLDRQCQLYERQVNALKLELAQLVLMDTGRQLPIPATQQTQPKVRAKAKPATLPTNKPRNLGRRRINGLEAEMERLEAALAPAAEMFPLPPRVEIVHADSGSKVG